MIQVLAKIGGKNRAQKSFGYSCDEATLDALEREAHVCIALWLIPSYWNWSASKNALNTKVILLIIVC